MLIQKVPPGQTREAYCSNFDPRLPMCRCGLHFQRLLASLRENRTSANADQAIHRVFNYFTELDTLHGSRARPAKKNAISNVAEYETKRSLTATVTNYSWPQATVRLRNVQTYAI